jgi:hypothetical protein
MDICIDVANRVAVPDGSKFGIASSLLCEGLARIARQASLKAPHSWRLAPLRYAMDRSTHATERANRGGRKRGAQLNSVSASCDHDSDEGDA